MSLHFSQLKASPHFVERLWDLWCIASVIGIWPRFIEPRLLFTTRLTLDIPTLDESFSGLKILQMSDLHFSSYMGEATLQRILKKAAALQPDIILFTGDLISYAELEDVTILRNFLQQLTAIAPVYAILGNHDYSSYVSLGEDNTPRLIEEHVSPLLKGFYRLLSSKKKSDDPRVTEPVLPHSGVVALFQECGVKLLHNETVQEMGLNITGLGDYMTKNLNPARAFQNRVAGLPTVVLSHNPDSYQALSYFPGDLMLFGHTHGGQVNLPYIWKKITPLVNKAFKSGLHRVDGRALYINRGLGASFPFRWFAPPELTLFTLQKGKAIPVKVRDKKSQTKPEFLLNPIS